MADNRDPLHDPHTGDLVVHGRGRDLEMALVLKVRDSEEDDGLEPGATRVVEARVDTAYGCRFRAAMALEAWRARPGEGRALCPSLGAVFFKKGFTGVREVLKLRGEWAHD